MEIIKTFKDGTVLVSANEGIRIMTLNEFDKMKINKFDLKDFLLKKISSKFPQCTFEIKEIKSRDHVFMDDLEITNISIGSIEFWMKDQQMNLDDIEIYVDSKILPNILMKACEIEYERCKDIQYFFDHYVRNKG